MKELISDVHRNLTTGRWSVRQQGLVVAYRDQLIMENARFVVQPAGSERAKREGVRNVHAFVRGKLLPNRVVTVPPSAREVTYRPFIDSLFSFADSGEMISSNDAFDVVYFTEDGKAWVHEGS